MSPELTLLSGLLIGLFGSVHCVGMCGGIAGTLTLGARLPGGRSLRALAPFLLAYNLGRIGSYAVAGAVVAGLGAQAFGWAAPERAHVVARLVSGGFALALGLYLGGWWYGLGALERAGARLWRRLAPLARRWLPVDRLPKALALGLLWGWLPCGMVYAALAWAALAGSAAQGAALMTAFGIGTLPALLGAGAGAGALAQAVRRPAWRRAAGIALLALGLHALAGLALPDARDPHAAAGHTRAHAATAPLAAGGEMPQRAAPAAPPALSAR